MDTLWIVIMFAVGVTFGFLLCATLIMGREDQRKGPQPPARLHPLESDSRF